MTQDQTQLWEAVKDIKAGLYGAYGSPTLTDKALKILAQATLALRLEAQQQPAPETSAGECTCWDSTLMAEPPLKEKPTWASRKGGWHLNICPMYRPAETAASATSSPDTTGTTEP